VTARTDYDALEQQLGYAFADRELLVLALRHTSWRNEHAEAAAGVRGWHDNERLEFLGDAVLDLVVGHALMVRYPQLREGELTVTRAQVVSESGLSEIASSLGLGEWLLLGKGEERSGGRAKPSILADAFEALIAAVFVDRGFDAARDLATRLLDQRLATVEFKGFYDFKTRLQEAAQAALKEPPTYRVVDQLGPDHDKRFVVAVSIAGREWARAIGRSKKEAEQAAAAEAHFKLDGADVPALLRELRRGG
jgi:ribonuclease-3